MKEQIENKLKLSNLKYWKNFAIAVSRDPSNFKRSLYGLIDKINGWLKEIGLELCVKEIQKCEHNWQSIFLLNDEFLGFYCPKCNKISK